MNKNIWGMRSISLCALFTALIAAGAFIKIPLPGAPPVTLQLPLVILTGLLLGPGRGAVSAGAYVFLGLAGFPVFAMGGGVTYIFQPTFGYILGFVPGAFIAGLMSRAASDISLRRLFGAGICATAVVYLAGMSYYYAVANLYLKSAITVKDLIFYCFLMTAPKDALLCFLSAAVAKRLLPVVSWKRRV